MSSTLTPILDYWEGRKRKGKKGKVGNLHKRKGAFQLAKVLYVCLKIQWSDIHLIAYGK